MSSPFASCSKKYVFFFSDLGNILKDFSETVSEIQVLSHAWLVPSALIYTSI